MYENIKEIYDSGDAGICVTCPKCGENFFYSAVSFPEKPVCPKCGETFELLPNQEALIKKMINFCLTEL